VPLGGCVGFATLTPSSWDLIGRVALAGGITALLGLERELSRHPAGIRTHALVGIGAALFTIAGAYGFGPNHDPSPTRVAAQVVTGIGFLGAGTILRQRDKIKGLTTAATLWLAAGLGLSAGAGLVSLTVATFVMALLVLLAVHITDPLIARYHRRQDERHPDPHELPDPEL
jgi:putative Mg2+ transporter-C (MgtC) family protein